MIRKECLAGLFLLALFVPLIGAATEIPIIAPTNTTYVVTSITSNFSYVTTIGGNCTRYLDGAYFASTNVTPNTYYQDVLTPLSLASHRYNVTCSNTTAGHWNSTQVYFLVRGNCTDGTYYSTCVSGAKPTYCNSTGSLVDNATICGCPSGYVKNVFDGCSATTATVIKTNADNFTYDIVGLSFSLTTVYMIIILAGTILFVSLRSVKKE